MKRVLLPSSSAVILVGLIFVLNQGTTRAQRSAAISERDVVKAAFEALIATGAPGHATHDEGEWLQRAVEDAISRGDREIERLAMRAAAPLLARISRPVSPTDDAPSLDFRTDTVLSLPRPIGYSARLYVSLDGQPPMQVGEVQSDKGFGFRLNTRLSLSTTPGGHHVRVRAELAFGGWREPSWTETRDLPELYYAIYDVRAPTPGDARIYVYSPATLAARDLDPLLPETPLAIWLADVFGARRLASDPAPEWVSEYCDERTDDPGSPRNPASICSVLYFAAGSRIGEIWTRTGDVRVSADRIDWVPRVPPIVEAILIGESALESPRLSMLPALLDTDPMLRPIADVSIAPNDIVISPRAPKPGAPAKAIVTVHNRGQADLHKVLVQTVYAAGPKERGTFHNFVVDVPASSAIDLSFGVMFPRGYGFVLAQAIRVSEHTPRAGSAHDPTPDDACAFRIVNPTIAPAGYRASLGDMTGCSGVR